MKSNIEFNETEGGSTMENEYWALSLNGNYMDEMHLSTIQDVLGHIDLYHVLYGPDEEVVGVVHDDVFSLIFDAISDQKIQSRKELTITQVADLVVDIEDYDLIVYGDQDETTYALLKRDYIDCNHVVEILNVGIDEAFTYEED